jgi:hypothetical protein
MEGKLATHMQIAMIGAVNLKSTAQLKFPGKNSNTAIKPMAYTRMRADNKR